MFRETSISRLFRCKSERLWARSGRHIIPVLWKKRRLEKLDSADVLQAGCHTVSWWKNPQNNQVKKKLRGKTKHHLTCMSPVNGIVYRSGVALCILVVVSFLPFELLRIPQAFSHVFSCHVAPTWIKILPAVKHYFKPGGHKHDSKWMRTVSAGWMCKYSKVC